MKRYFSAKKFISVALAFVLAFAMTVTAFAATKPSDGDGYVITIRPGNFTDTTKTDRFKAYEVFTGTLTKPGADGVLTSDQAHQLADIKWGADIVPETLIEALATDANGDFEGAFGDIRSYDGDEYEQTLRVAQTLSEHKNDSAFLVAFARAVQASLSESASPVSSVFADPDFKISVGNPGYYLVVDDPGDDTADGDVLSEYILEVLGNQSIDIKADAPSVDKTMVENKGSYEIGQTIRFRLIGTLAENYLNYSDVYFYKFNDTMSKGLTYAGDDTVTVKAYSVNPDGSLKDEMLTVDAAQYEIKSVKSEEDGTTLLTIEFADLKDIAGLQPEYVIVVEYDAFLNDDAKIVSPETNEVFLTFSNNPNGDGKNETTDVPGPDVPVYTFTIDATKLDSVTDEPLPGVSFKLYKQKDAEAADSADNNLYGVFYEKGNTYTLKEENGWTNKDDATLLVTGEDGMLHIKGIGEGTYFLEEAEPLNGYNTLTAPVEITITAEYYNSNADGHKEGELKSVTCTIGERSEKFAGIDEDAIPVLGTVAIKVLNTPAGTLPNTGGIGTYIFYISGSLLLAGAAAYLIVSKIRNKSKAQ